MSRELLTSSRMTALLACPRKHYLRYEIGLVAQTNATALRFGSAWHSAMEARWNNASYEVALASAVNTAESFTEIEIATLSGLLAGYYRKWSGESEVIAHLMPEIEFNYPIQRSLLFDAAGKIDGLGTLRDGRCCLLEHKSSGEDIAPDSDYWMRLRFNSQIYQYVTAARELGYDIQTIIYDVTRKPSIRQKQTETGEQYADRLAADTLERPDFYFARREVAVMDDDIDQFLEQRLNLGKMILHFRASAKRQKKPEFAWPRNCNGLTCRMCEYSGFCLANVSVDINNPPQGFKAGVFNQELTKTTGGEQPW